MRTFSLGAGADTVAFAATAAANGEDEITGFTAGASGDELDFKTFLSGSAGTIVKGALTSGLDLTSSKVGVVAKAGGTIGSGDIATTASSGKVGIADNGKAVVLVVDNADADTAGAVNIYYVEDTDTGGTQNWSVQLVGKITDSIAANTFVDGNFA